MVLPVDMPALTRQDLISLIGAYKHADAAIEFVGPMVGARPGNPVLFSKRIASQIAQGEGDFGSGAWRHQRPEWLLEWQTDNLHYVADIDTPEDLDSWIQ
jgi:CTP:molybdopterin cytidylyltransferase MocA